MSKMPCENIILLLCEIHNTNRFSKIKCVPYDENSFRIHLRQNTSLTKDIEFSTGVEYVFEKEQIPSFIQDICNHIDDHIKMERIKTEEFSEKMQLSYDSYVERCNKFKTEPVCFDLWLENMDSIYLGLKNE